MKTATKIWLGVGAFVVAGAGATATPAVSGQARQPSGQLPPGVLGPARTATSAIVLAQHVQHGGEAGEKGAGSLPPDLQFGLRIGLLRGHLLIGDQLVQEGRWNAALPHFLHPAEEIYGDIRGSLKDYHVPPFEAALKALANTVKRKKGGTDYAKARKTVLDAIAKADAGLKAKQAGWAGFTVETAVEVIKSAGGEYEEAIVKGRIAKPVEYQDARGFVWHAAMMVDGVAGELEKKDANALSQIRARLAELKAVFPTAMPPKQPVKSHDDVQAIIAQLELAAGPLM